MARRILYILLIFLFSVHAATAAPENGYSITYTIDVAGNGNAVWYVEYRTPLVSKEDFDAFENYTIQLNSVYLKEFKDLMVSSVLEAENATSRKMIAGGFMGDARVQTAPTGTYGVVRYSFTWTNFAETDADRNINIGDVFAGGLYLSKDNTLIIQYPSGYTIEKVTPEPDQVRDSLIWYGLRSFKAGEPAISLLKTSDSWMQYDAIIFIIFIIATGTFIYNRKKKAKGRDSEPAREAVTETITEADLMDIEDRIINLLKESGGSMYQVDIGKNLGLPKSTVSSALNGLHDKNIIQKIKKGRENLIRLT